LGNHGDAVGGLVDDGFDDESAFCPAHRGEFPGGPACDDAVDAAVDTAVDQSAQCAFVDRSVRSEWCCKRGQYAAETCGHVALLRW
jgi:hypothetical protein